MRDLARRGLILLAMTVLWSSRPDAAVAGTDNVTGHLSAFTTMTDGILLMIDAGLPTNCTGTPYGWMKIPSPSPMAALVLGVWLQGAVSTTTFTIYTGGLGADGWCAVTQVEPSIT